MFEPMKSHIVIDKLVKVPKKAPAEFENGTNMPKQKRPNIGPPIALFEKVFMLEKESCIFSC
jgi:hypothetical protein